MDGATPPEIPSDYGQALAAVGAASLATLGALETILRRLHPPALPQLREVAVWGRDTRVAQFEQPVFAWR